MLEQAQKIETIDFEQHGIHVFKNAFSTENLDALLENLKAYRREALRILNDGITPAFAPKLDFRIGGLAVRLFGLDPDTRYDETENVPKTSLFKAIAQSRCWPDIESVLFANVTFRDAWIRVVDRDGGGTAQRKGALFFHQEKWALRNHKNPLGHNIWMCLDPDGITSNAEIPGLQFAVGEMALWRQDNTADYEKTAQPRISRLNALSRETADSKAEIIEADGYTLYRPHLGLGDMVLFDHHVLHSSFVPKHAIASRISCEIRAYPAPG